MASTPPRPKTPIFDGHHDTLGDVPGPSHIDVIDDVIWAAGDHDSKGVVLRYGGGRWERFAIPTLPNFVLAISATEAITGGGAGNLGRTRDGGATWTWEQLADNGNRLHCASLDRAGRVWIGQQEGGLWRAEHAGAPFEQVAAVSGSVNNLRQISETQAMVVTSKIAYRLDLKKATVRRLFESGELSMVDGAIDDRGRIVIVGHSGKAWLADDGETFEAIEVRPGAMVDFAAVSWVDGWFTVLGYNGNLRISRDGTTWQRFKVEPQRSMCRLGSIASYRGGWLVGGTRNTPAREGTLAYFGNPAVAPVLPTRPPATLDGVGFVLAERYALLWATDWKSLPDARAHAEGWMKLAAKLA